MVSDCTVHLSKPGRCRRATTTGGMSSKRRRPPSSTFHPASLSAGLRPLNTTTARFAAALQAAHERSAHPSVSFPRGLVGSGRPAEASQQPKYCCHVESSKDSFAFRVVNRSKRFLGLTFQGAIWQINR